MPATGNTPRRYSAAEADHALSVGRYHGGGDDADGVLWHLLALPQRVRPVVPSQHLSLRPFPPGREFPCLSLAPMLISSLRRGVAQPGSAPVLGTGGRRFESSRPDHPRQ